MNAKIGDARTITINNSGNNAQINISEDRSVLNKVADCTVLQEQTAGSNPRNADSDGDGLSDSAEMLTHHTNPLAADLDREA